MSTRRGKSWKFTFRTIPGRNSVTESARTACENSIPNIPRNEQSGRNGACAGGAAGVKCTRFHAKSRPEPAGRCRITAAPRAVREVVRGYGAEGCAFTWDRQKIFDVRKFCERGFFAARFIPRGLIRLPGRFELK